MITIMYSCHGCGIVKRKLQVPAREHPDIDVKAYVDSVALCVKMDHEKVSPRCSSEKCDLMLPADGEFIGQQVE